MLLLHESHAPVTAGLPVATAIAAAAAAPVAFAAAPGVVPASSIPAGHQAANITRHMPQSGPLAEVRMKHVTLGSGGPRAMAHD